MLEFSYIIKDPLGLHARPAGMLAKEAKKYSSVCSLRKGDQTVPLTRLMALMNLAVKAGDAVLITADGEDEADAIQGLKTFFEQHL